MKLFNIKSFLAVLFLSMFLMTACDETTDPIDTDVPEPAKNLMATSLDATSIKVKWTASTSETNTLWAGYYITVTGDDGSSLTPVTVTADKNPYTITGLTEGTVYTITVKAKFTNGELSTAAEVKWSPASRFTQTAFSEPIMIYEYASDYGSGLQLYNPDESGPQVRKTTSKDLWDLGLDTRSGNLLFGSATQISMGTGTPAATEISDPLVASSLDEVYGSAALSNLTFSEKTIDLSAQTGSFVIVVRSKGNNATYNYAKILVEKGTSGFLQGTSPDRYLRVYISYQKKAGVPYAKIK